MIPRRLCIRLICAAAIAVQGVVFGSCVAAESPTASGVAGDSVYQLPLTLTDQNNRAFALAELRGKPVIVSMFYNSCKFVCPMLIDTIRDTVQALKPGNRDKIKVLLVTFDPAHDDVATLKQITLQRKLDTNTWTLARCDAPGVRKLAALLGIQYRKLPNGDYNHTTALILLDAQGRIAGSTNRIGTTDGDFVAKVDKTVE